MGADTKNDADANWLLDGSIYFFRGYFGLGDTLFDDEGQSCGGVHGFASALIEVLARHPGRPGAVAFDASLGTCFRNELYSAYKANRAPPDANIVYQFAQCARLCALLGVPSHSSERFEADDILATLAARSRSKIVIYSKDKDLRQVVGVNASLCDLPSGECFDAKSFFETYRFRSGLFPDYQALVGDSSDNVPGVPGFGPKTAGKLVERYGTLERIFSSIVRWSDDKVGVPSQGKLADNLLQHREQALEMRALLRLSKNVPLPAGAMRRTKVQLGLLEEFMAAKKLRRIARIVKINPEMLEIPIRKARNHQ